MASQRNEIEKVYSLFCDESSKLPVAKLENAIRSAGYVVKDLKDISFSQSYLSFPEFVELISQSESNEMSKEQVEESFKAFDPENTGFIKAVDLKRILSAGEDSLTEEEINSILEMFPPNDEGSICYNLPINYVYKESRK